MDTNYAAIKSLIGLLVKKAGFNIDKNYSENELVKTNNTINRLKNDNTLSDENKESLIKNLKIRKATWENNAEVIGKDLLKSFDQNKSYNEVRMKIEYLKDLANKDMTLKENNSLMSYIYDKINELESEYKKIIEKIENTDYINHDDKKMDKKMKDILSSRIESHKDELSIIEKELKRLNNIEANEKLVIEKTNHYVAKVKKDYENLNELKNNSIDKEISLEVWEKIETFELNIKEKLEQTLSIIKKSDKNIEHIENKRNNLKAREKKYLEETEKFTKKLADINTRLEEDDYVDYYNKIKDVNKKELIRLELTQYKNKKEVIYVDANTVTEELINEWKKKNPGNIHESVKEVKEEVKVYKQAKHEPKKETIRDIEREILKEEKEEEIKETPEEIKERKLSQTGKLFNTLNNIFGDKDKKETVKEHKNEEPKKEEKKETVKIEKKKERIELDW